MPNGIGINGGEADALVNREPLALVLAMLLDQQIPMEWAFAAPLHLRERLGGHLDAHVIASLEPDAVVELFQRKPALHRYPRAMGRRAHEVCQHVATHYDGDASRIWSGARDADEVYRRLRAVPGFGAEKAKIFVAILGKRYGVQPAGWQRIAAPFSDEVPRSVADIDGPDALQRVRTWKKAQKAQGLGKQD